MYCKYCKVNVDTAYDVCPLCKNPLEGTPSSVPPFPERKPRKKKSPVTFKGIYAAFTLPVIFICVLLNILLPHKYLWALMAAIGFLYVYLTIKTTVFYKGAGGAKIFSQTIMLTLLTVSIQYIFHMPEWAFSFGIPVIVITSLIMHVLLVGVFHKKKGNQYLRYMWLTSMVGVIPAILLACGLCSFAPLALASLAVSGVSLISLLIFTGRTIAEEIRKKSHL